MGPNLCYVFDATLTLREASGVSTIENLLSGENFVMMNTSRPPMDDIRVRQALTFATDRQGYIDLIGQGVLEGADSMYHPDLPENNPDVVQEGDDPDAAAALAAAPEKEVHRMRGRSRFLVFFALLLVLSGLGVDAFVLPALKKMAGR